MNKIEYCDLFFIQLAAKMELIDQIAEFSKSHHYITYECTNDIVILNIIDNKRDKYVELEIYCDDTLHDTRVTTRMIYNDEIYMFCIRYNRTIDFITLLYQLLLDNKLDDVYDVARKEKMTWHYKI